MPEGDSVFGTAIMRRWVGMLWTLGFVVALLVSSGAPAQGQGKGSEELGEGERPVKARPAKRMDVQQKKIPELPEDLNVEDLLKPDAYTYEPAGKRDPFRSLTESRDWEITKKVGLERFDISELKLTGIVVGVLGRFAMIEAPDLLTYFVSVDGSIGMNNGKVVRVDDSSIVVEEAYTDDFGNSAIRQVILALEEAD